MTKASSKKRKIVETVAGAAVGAAIAGPVGALTGGFVASQVASHASRHRESDCLLDEGELEARDLLLHADVKRILVPLDFSKPSMRTLPFAREWAERFGSEICLIHVIEPNKKFVAFESDPFTPPIPVKNQGGHAGTELEKLAREYLPDSIRVTVLVREGVPYDQIVAAAQELQVDLIIVATEGHGFLSRALVGSTAERVVRHASCPVLTLRRSP